MRALLTSADQHNKSTSLALFTLLFCFFEIVLRLLTLHAHTKTVVTSVHYTAAPSKLV